MKKPILLIVLLASALSVKAQVTTLYGNGGSGYSASSTKADSVNIEFFSPYGCAFDTKGNTWITDQFNNYIVMINAGKYEIREGYNGGGFNDGSAASQFGGVVDAPTGIVVVPGKTPASDQIYLSDANNGAIRKIDSFVNLGNAQPMTTVAGGGTKVKGSLGKTGYKDGAGTVALFSNPLGIGYISDANGVHLIVADQGNNAIREVSLNSSDYGNTSTLARITNPQGIFVDASHNNNIYVASMVTGINEVSSLVGTVTNVVSSRYLEGPTSVVIKGTDMYIADNCHIAYFDMTKTASSSNPSILAGDPADANCAFEDGTDAQALFNGIQSMTLSPDSTYLVVADAMNNRFRKVMLPTSHTSAVQEYINAAVNKFNVYPNPATDHVFITHAISEDADMSLITVTGKQVCHNTVSLVAGQPYEMNLENQAPGIYFLQISTVEGVYNCKIVIR